MSPEREHWSRFKEDCDPSSRHWLIEYHAPLVVQTRQRYFSHLPATFDRDDLESVGRIRLIEAVDKYLPAPERQFPPYAARSIRWAMVDAVRQDNWVPTPSAAGHQRGINFERLDDPDASFLGEGWGANERATLADVLPDGSLSVERACLLALARARLDQQLARLPVKERDLLQNYYRDGMDLGEAARVLGRGKRRACEIKARAVLQLRRTLGEDQLLLSILDDRG